MLVILPSLSRYCSRGRPEEGVSLDPGSPGSTWVGWPLSKVIGQGLPGSREEQRKEWLVPTRSRRESPLSDALRVSFSSRGESLGE